MAKMIILRGVSGSGKSTWARQQNATVVSRDSLREVFFPHLSTEEYYKSPVLRQMEEKITRLQDAAIAALLKSGEDVIVDNTNIEWKYVKALAKIATKAGADVEVKVFDVPVNDSILRDAIRASRGGRKVGADIIHKQHQRFQGSKDNTLEPVFVPAPYHGTPDKPKAFLVDIDGTLAHMRDHRGPFDWAKVGLDDLDEVVSDIVSRLWLSTASDDYDPLNCIVMSGRDESCRVETAKWLDLNNVPWDHLFMRPEKDMRPDNLVKAELFDNYVRDHYDVKFVLDDRDQVVDMWRAMGLTCLQVAPGDF